MKGKIIIAVVLSLLVAFQIAILSCKSEGETEKAIKEVTVENDSRYVFKKIYIEDHNGYTHEILTSSSGNTMGGVGMLELCVYKEDGRTKEIN